MKSAVQECEAQGTRESAVEIKQELTLIHLREHFCRAGIFYCPQNKNKESHCQNLTNILKRLCLFSHTEVSVIFPFYIWEISENGGMVVLSPWGF